MDGVKNYLIYFVCIGFLFVFLYFSVRIFEEKNNIINMKLYAMVSDYENKNISIEDDKKNISYPSFGYDTLDKEILKFISQFDSDKDVSVVYSVNITKELITIFFNINKSGVISYKNINYDIVNQKFCDINSVFDFNTFGDEVLDKVSKKYSTYIYETVVSDSFNSVSVDVKDEGIYVYFNPEIFDNVIHKVYVFFPSEDGVYASDISYDKVIAFTFDDGPGEYTSQIVDALIANDSKATFFELGNRMKYYQDIVRDVYNRGMEVASHTYAHKNLNNLSADKIDEEINSTNIIFNEITGDNIKYLRPPYGNANELVKSRVNTPIINWNVDTEDWLSRDSDKVYNHILENAQDGDIILMHDIYPETLEAVKKVLPALREMGFKITSISGLAEEKGRTLEVGHIYRSIK